MYVKNIFYIMLIYLHTHTHLLCNMNAGTCKACQKVGKEDKDM